MNAWQRCNYAATKDHRYHDQAQHTGSRYASRSKCDECKAWGRTTQKDRRDPNDVNRSLKPAATVPWWRPFATHQGAYNDMDKHSPKPIDTLALFFHV